MLTDTKNSLSSSIFGGANVVMESALKDPNQFRNAILFESLSSLPESKIKEFINSEEAKTMLTEGLITQDALERLVSEKDTGILKTTVCHMAKENGDPLWDELVKHRIEERRLLNDMIEKYKEDAKPLVNGAKKDIIDKCIPEYFRNN